MSPVCHVVGKEMLKPTTHRCCRDGCNDEPLVAVGPLQAEFISCAV